MAKSFTAHVVQRQTQSGSWTYVYMFRDPGNADAELARRIAAQPDYQFRVAELPAIDFENGDKVEAEFVQYASDDDGIDREVGGRAVRGTVSVDRLTLPSGRSETYVRLIVGGRRLAALNACAIEGASTVLRNIRIIED